MRKSGHKSNLFPKHKSILCWRCFREFMVLFFSAVSRVIHSLITGYSRVISVISACITRLTTEITRE
jgi:hypothetical protein